MKKIIIALFLLISACHTGEVHVKNLEVSSTSWDGSQIKYPETNEEVTAIYITMGPKEQLPYHCHPVPTIGYIISGAIEVEKMDGEKHRFEAGDTIYEVVNTWHRGRNLSSIYSAELVVFYVGEKGLKNTIIHSDKSHDKCE